MIMLGFIGAVFSTMAIILNWGTWVTILLGFCLAVNLEMLTKGIIEKVNKKGGNK